MYKMRKLYLDLFSSINDKNNICIINFCIYTSHHGVNLILIFLLLLFFQINEENPKIKDMFDMSI